MKGLRRVLRDETWLVTGAAGFIGFHVAGRLLADGARVVGVDNLNAYYDPALKQARARLLEASPAFVREDADIRDAARLDALFGAHRPATVVHLAAQAGVRHSLDHPAEYIDNNLVGFGNVLEACRRHEVRHLVYASSSSVYGMTSRMPFSVHDAADHPVSLYAATKRANELMAHSYSHLYRLPCTGLRFFTVYGPWGRPDMAYYAFAEALLDGRPITVYGDGTAERDFTYVDDIVEGVVRVAGMPARGDPRWDREAPDPGSSRDPWRLFNIGHGSRAAINELIATLERLLERAATRVQAPAQPGDVPVTHADVADLSEQVGFTAATPLPEGLERFTRWFRDYRAGSGAPR